MNFSVFTKQICRFLIQRYMGQYLKTELTSDQLELHLADGTASVQGVMLNSEFINETLEASGVRVLSLKDGYVEELTVCVPWKRLLLDSTIVKINGLQLTLTPLEEINMANTQELMSSFVGSIASSMELAKSVIVDEQLASGADNSGIEQCASLIDQVIARIKVQFENVTIRLESYSADLCTGIEVQIDRMEFLDEQLEEQQRNVSSNAITEQPGGLYTVTDLNKLLHIQNVRLYTDIWSPIRDNRMCTSRTSDATESDGPADMVGSAMNFQSCYSHFSSRSNSNTFSQQKSQDIIPPNPTLIAQLFDDTHTLRIRVKNNSALSYAENSFYNKRIDVDLLFRGPLYLLLTPSQLVLLQNLCTLLAPKGREECGGAGGRGEATTMTSDHEFFGTTHSNPHNNNVGGGGGGERGVAGGGGVPMGPQQYAKLIEQMQKGVGYEEKHHQQQQHHHYQQQHHQPTTTFGLGPGSWSGMEQRFYDLSELVELEAGSIANGYHHSHQHQHNHQQQQRKGVGGGAAGAAAAHCPLPMQGVGLMDTSSTSSSNHSQSTTAHHHHHQQAGGARYRSNSLDDTQQGMGAHSNRQSSTSIATLVERRPDIFSVSIRAPALVAVITHDDPLGEDAIIASQADGCGGGERSSPSPLLVASVIQQMNERAENFFNAAQRVKMAKRRLEEQREKFDELYDGDCLRIKNPTQKQAVQAAEWSILVVTDFFTAFTFTSDLQRVLLESKGHLKECDFIECLRPKNGGPTQFVDILNIAVTEERRNVLKNDILTFQISNTFEKQNDYKINVSVEQCKMEVDFSLVDRVSGLLCVQPFFTKRINKMSSSSALSDSMIIGGLRDDFELGQSQPMPKTFHAKCYFNKLLLNLRIPISNNTSLSDGPTTADHSAASPSSSDASYRLRTVHPEYLHLSLDSAHLEMPKFALADLSLFWTLNLECKSAKGTFVGDPTLLQCSREAMTFFFADTPNAEKAFGNKGIRLELRYDSRNKALSKALQQNIGGGVAFGEGEEEGSFASTKSLYESFYRPSEADRLDGPFSKKNAYFTYNCASSSAFDQKVIMAGGRHEMLEFAKECQQQTNIAIELFISQLNIAFPCQKFFELLYNRFAFDLALWRPKSPHFAKQFSALNECMGHQQNDHQRHHQQQQKFTECFSTFLPFNGSQMNDPSFMDESVDHHQHHRLGAAHGKGKPTASTKAGGDSHLLTVAVHVTKAHLLLQTTVKEAEKDGAAQNDGQDGLTDDHSQPFNAQLVADFFQSECFFVYGFCEDPNLAYFFLTASKAELFHNNLLAKAKPICADVTDSQLFAVPTAKQKAESVCCCFEDASATGQQFERVDDDNLAIALKMHCQPEPKNTKNIFVAFGLRNSLVHLRPFPSTRFFWLHQFANFFTVADYDGVPGYVLPKVEANLHVHLQSVFAGYDHCLTTPSSPFQLRVEIGLAYLTSNIVKDIARLKFDCHLHDLIMWMSKKPARSSSSTLDNSDEPTTPPVVLNTFNHAQQSPAVVKVFHCEAIHFIVACTIAVGEVPGPLFDFECANNTVTVWLCADAAIEFLNVLSELYKSDTVQRLLSNDAKTERAQQERLAKLIECSSKRNANANANTKWLGRGTPATTATTTAATNISLEEEQRLIKMMEAAMSDLSATIPQNNKTQKNGGGGATDGDRAQNNGVPKNLREIDETINDLDGYGTAHYSPPNSSTSTDINYDEFIFLDMPPKSGVNGGPSGVTQIGDKFQTRIDMGGDFEFVAVPIGGGDMSGAGTGGTVPLSKTVDDMTTNLCPLFSFEIALSLDIFLFGGTDFGDSARIMSRKTYSKWNSHSLDRRMSERIGSRGGKYRDHTVIVQVQVSKLSFVTKVFDKSSPVLSYNKLRVGEFKVFDHLSISHINEMVHRMEGHRAANTPFFSGYLIEDPLREAILRISLAPIRMNIDQDTIEFLMDFKNDVVQSLRTTFDFPVSRRPTSSGVGAGGTASDDIPLMEVSKESGGGTASTAGGGVKREEDSDGDDRHNAADTITTTSAATNGIYPKVDKVDKDLTVSFKVLKTREELLDEEEEAANNLDGLFSEEDVQFSDSFCAKLNLEDNNEEQQQQQNDHASATINGTAGSQNGPKRVPPPNRKVVGNSDEEECGSSSPNSNCSGSSSSNNTGKTEVATSPPGGLAAKDTFIKDFSFSPACLLRIDYEAKRVKTDQQGALIGFLIGMANLNKTELTLKEMHIERGFLGIEKCAQFVVNEWVKDIMNKQFPNVVGSLAPINALVQLAHGFHDLFALPYDELRKENGQLIRGIQRGTTSFGLNAATAAIDATQRVVGLVQNVAELAFDMVNPNFQRHRRLLAGPQRVLVAGDLREGFSLAYNTVREGVLDTAQTLQAAAAEDRALGGLGMGVLRHMTPSAIKPFVIASKATSQVLGGLKNQLKPEDYREELRKWRQINGNNVVVGAGATIRRQGSASAIPCSSSSSSSSASSSTSSTGGSFQQRVTTTSVQQPRRGVHW